MGVRVGSRVQRQDHGCKGGVMGARVGPWVAEGGVAEGGVAESGVAERRGECHCDADNQCRKYESTVSSLENSQG